MGYNVYIVIDLIKVPRSFIVQSLNSITMIFLTAITICTLQKKYMVATNIRIEICCMVIYIYKMLIITYILFADLITFESRWIEVYTFFLTLLHDFMFCCYSFSLYHNFYLFYLSINVLQLVSARLDTEFAFAFVHSVRFVWVPCTVHGTRKYFFQ